MRPTDNCMVLTTISMHFFSSLLSDLTGMNYQSGSQKRGSTLRSGNEDDLDCASMTSEEFMTLHETTLGMHDMEKELRVIDERPGEGLSKIFAR